MAMHGVLPGQIKVLLRLATLMLTLKISRCGHNSNGAPKITASPSRETEACELARLFERFGTDKLPMHHYQRAYCLFDSVPESSLNWASSEGAVAQLLQPISKTPLCTALTMPNVTL